VTDVLAWPRRSLEMIIKNHKPRHIVKPWMERWWGHLDKRSPYVLWVNQKHSWKKSVRNICNCFAELWSGCCRKSGVKYCWQKADFLQLHFLGVRGNIFSLPLIRVLCDCMWIFLKKVLTSNQSIFFQQNLKTVWNSPKLLDSWKESFLLLLRFCAHTHTPNLHPNNQIVWACHSIVQQTMGWIIRKKEEEEERPEPSSIHPL